MPMMYAPDDPRVDAVVDLLAGFPDGLQKVDIEPRFRWSRWVTREALRAGLQAKRLAIVPIGHGRVLWATALNGKRLAARAKAESKRAAALRQRDRRQRAAPRRLYDDPSFRPDSVPDMPETRRWVSDWPRPTKAPGPVSVFALGAWL